MKLNLLAIYNKNLIQQAINTLDKNKIHLLYLCYNSSFSNFRKNPLLITTKLLNAWNGDNCTDHICHISKFRLKEDGKNWSAKIFEASIDRGMEENDLEERLKRFEGVCYIGTIDKIVDKKKADEFRKKYLGIEYSKDLAFWSGVDITIIDKNLKAPKRDGLFCSALEAIFLEQQGISIKHIEKGNYFEITPADLFNSNLHDINIFWKS